MKIRIGRTIWGNLWFTLSLVQPILVFAQECPGPGASLIQVYNEVSNFQKNDRSPAGADCAYTWASNFDLESSEFGSQVLAFFRAASDIQRSAAEKRYAAGLNAAGDKYLNQEISLRQKFLKEALRRDVSGTGPQNLRFYVVTNISYLVSALARLRQYDKVAEDLGGRDPGFIDDEALKVWLQAVWSCARWDGNKTNLCSEENRRQCKDKIDVFLESVELMKNRSFPPQTRKDIDALKQLATSGCLKP